MAKALVIGGTGFVGLHVVENLLQRNDDVTIASRGVAKDPFGTRVRRLTVDRHDYKSFRSLGEESWDVVFDQRCYSPIDALNACKTFRGKIHQYVFASSQSVYDFGANLREELFRPEEISLEFNPDAAFSYAEGKRLAEGVFFQKKPFPVAAVRLPIVLGPDDNIQTLQLYVKKILKEEPISLANSEAKLSFISSQEAGQFLVWVAEKWFHGPINACSRDTMSLGELARLIGKYAGKEPVLVEKTDGLEASHIPFSRHWSMDHAKASSLGFPFSALGEWLPAVVSALIEQISSRENR
jgi:nucleoside-diphosphate-sugar epimerase